MYSSMRETLEPLHDPPSSPLSLGYCQRCGSLADVRTRHLLIEGSQVRVYCSERCAEQPARPLAPATRKQASAWQHLLRIAVGVPMLVFTSGPSPVPPIEAKPVARAAPEPPRFGPSWPPSEQDWQMEIARDAWLHPLDGPARRMPIRDARVFGAERPGDRPAECRNGHCGVDIGGEVWGEPVHASHDGIVDRVQRGPNEDHGGLYVRIAHRGGTIFTQYFHLAAIPRHLERGSKVRIGDVIGLVGDSGVKHSSAHLHFTVSVKPSAQLPEQYVDPEPLIALWPLRMPVGGGAMVSASEAPGVPLGAAGKRRPHHHDEHAQVEAPDISE
jgi:murein DD-endopeptidase MepM/ murein hydrolase activator NlpD